MANTHIQNTIESFPLQPTPLEITILTQLPTQPQLTKIQAQKNLHKFLLMHITNLHQLILPNGTKFKSTQNFILYHGPLIRSLTNALKFINKLVPYMQQ